jgi:hypothetical protein
VGVPDAGSTKCLWKFFGYYSLATQYINIWVDGSELVKVNGDGNIRFLAFSGILFSPAMTLASVCLLLRLCRQNFSDGFTYIIVAETVNLVSMTSCLGMVSSIIPPSTSIPVIGMIA